MPTPLSGWLFRTQLHFSSSLLPLPPCTCVASPIYRHVHRQLPPSNRLPVVSLEFYSCAASWERVCSRCPCLQRPQHTGLVRVSNGKQAWKGLLVKRHAFMQRSASQPWLACF